MFTQGEGKAAAGSVEVQEISVIGAVAFVVFASTMLLLLFFFLNHVFAIVLARPALRHRAVLQLCDLNSYY